MLFSKQTSFACTERTVRIGQSMGLFHLPASCGDIRILHIKGSKGRKYGTHVLNPAHSSINESLRSYSLWIKQGIRIAY